MVFLNGDDDALETWAVTDVNEMEAPNLPPSVNVVVQFDRIPGYSTANVPASDTVGGNWTDTHRAVIVHDTNTSDVSTAFPPAVPAPGNSELNMGTTQTLVDFVTWATTNHPADKYALILWDHGNGWRDCSNDLTDSDEITMTELRTALNQIGSVDLLGFDMCLMGMAGHLPRSHALGRGHERGTAAQCVPRCLRDRMPERCHQLRLGAHTGGTKRRDALQEVGVP